MKLWQIVGGAAALTITLAGCAQKSAYVPTQAAGNPAAAQTQIQGPAVTGSLIYVSALRCRRTPY